MRLRQKLCVFLISIISLPTWQDDLRAADSKEEELRDAWSAEYLKLASETRIVSKSNSAEIALKNVPLMRWSNPVRGNGSTSGDFFVWTRKNQPVVVGTFFSYVSDGLPSMRRGAMAFHTLVAEDFDV